VAADGVTNNAGLCEFIQKEESVCCPGSFGKEAAAEYLQKHCTLTPNITPDLLLLFQGEASRYSMLCKETSEPYPSHELLDSVDVVNAYCKSDLNWIYHNVIGKIPDQMNVRITVLSKCNEEARIPLFTKDRRVASLNIIKLPNVGGCDYACTHYINNYLNETSPSIVTLFAEDTVRDKQHFHFPHHKGYRNVRRMVDIASRGEFACGIEPQYSYSWYHETDTLYNFKLESYTRVSDRGSNSKAQFNNDLNFNRYNIRDMKEFHNLFLNYSFPQQFTPVCYGGSFAVPTKNIVNFLQSGGNEVLKKVEWHLAEGALVLEEHYIERSWAGFFSEELSSSQTEALQTRMNHVVKRGDSIYGMVAFEVQTRMKHIAKQRKSVNGLVALKESHLSRKK
jgi:hypothetical protein